MSKAIMGSGIGPRVPEYQEFIDMIAAAAGVKDKPWTKIVLTLEYKHNPTFAVEMYGNDEDIPAAVRAAKKDR